jgi:hypothetical protein
MLVLGASEMPMTSCSAQEPSRYQITTHRSDDRVTTVSEDERVVFKIESPFGISKATIARCGERWPETVILQLRLKGLESIRIVAEPMDLRGALSSQNGEFRLWRGTEESDLLNSESPYWVALRFLDRDGNPTKAAAVNERPLVKDGMIELRLPKSLFEANPASFTVHWIDFYR